MSEFLTFRKMVTPFFIQLLFWLGVIGAIIGGIVMMTLGDQLLLGLATLILGPLVVRIYAELLIVVFRIHGSLNQLVKLAKEGDGRAVAQPAAAAGGWQSSGQQPASRPVSSGYGQGGSPPSSPGPSSGPPPSGPPSGPPPSGPPS